MTVERVVGRVDTAATAVDWVTIDWQQTVRRALRLQSASGRRVNVLLPRDHPTLRHGDRLTTDASPLAIAVRPVRLLCCSPTHPRTLALLAVQLGNLHVAMEIRGDEGQIVTLDDGPAREIIDALRVACVAMTDHFHPERFSVLTPIVSRMQ